MVLVAIVLTSITFLFGPAAKGSILETLLAKTMFLMDAWTESGELLLATIGLGTVVTALRSAGTIGEVASMLILFLAMLLVLFAVLMALGYIFKLVVNIISMSTRRKEHAAEVQESSPAQAVSYPVRSQSQTFAPVPEAVPYTPTPRSAPYVPPAATEPSAPAPQVIVSSVVSTPAPAPITYASPTYTPSAVPVSVKSSDVIIQDHPPVSTTTSYTTTTTSYSPPVALPPRPEPISPPPAPPAPEVSHTSSISSAPDSTSSVLDELLRLKRLFEEGRITKEELAERQRKILS